MNQFLTETPNAIYEGEELGYALSIVFDVVMDKPNLLVTCVVDDGELESGSTVTAWHVAKYIDPRESGVMLLIVYVNGFKSEYIIYSYMDNKEIIALFTCYDY